VTRVLYLNELLAAKKVHPPPWATGDAALAADYQAFADDWIRHPVTDRERFLVHT
jgi:hypothetical protein